MTADKLQRAARSRARVFGTGLMLLGVALGMSEPARAQSESGRYQLGPLDHVRVKIVEWRASKDEVYEWKALNDEYTVGPGGEIAMPLIGEVVAGDQTSESLAERIARQFQQRMGTAEAPSVTVEVVRFRPFYITGDVTTPGEFPYRPGLTVLQATTLAGGFYRDTTSSPRQLSREAISARGDLGLLNTELAQALARRARLESEMRGNAEIKFPAELAQRRSLASMALLFEQEELIFQTRRTAFEAEVKALDELKAYLGKEVQSIESQMHAQDKQVELSRKELDGVQTLMKKGLSVASRELGIERSIAQLESEGLRVSSQLAHTRQELSKTDIMLLELRNKRANDITTELRLNQAKIDELMQKYSITETLLATSQSNNRAQARRLGDRQPLFFISRQGNEFAADETARIAPGDTLKVELPLVQPGAAETPPAGSAGAPRKPAAANDTPPILRAPKPEPQVGNLAPRGPSSNVTD
jgi:protein involved in polysaccharide export with SLBB domain